MKANTIIVVTTFLNGFAMAAFDKVTTSTTSMPTMATDDDVSSSTILSTYAYVNPGPRCGCREETCICPVCGCDMGCCKCPFKTAVPLCRWGKYYTKTPLSGTCIKMRTDKPSEISGLRSYFVQAVPTQAGAENTHVNELTPTGQLTHPQQTTHTSLPTQTEHPTQTEEPIQMIKRTNTDKHTQPVKFPPGPDPPVSLEKAPFLTYDKPPHEKPTHTDHPSYTGHSTPSKPIHTGKPTHTEKPPYHTEEPTYTEKPSHHTEQPPHHTEKPPHHTEQPPHHTDKPCRPHMFTKLPPCSRARPCLNKATCTHQGRTDRPRPTGPCKRPGKPPCVGHKGGDCKSKHPYGEHNQPTGGDEHNKPAGGHEHDKPAGGHEHDKPAGGHEHDKPAGGQQTGAPKPEAMPMVAGADAMTAEGMSLALAIMAGLYLV